MKVKCKMHNTVNTGWYNISNCMQGNIGMTTVTRKMTKKMIKEVWTQAKMGIEGTKKNTQTLI